MAYLQLELISKEIIKPTTPTPSNLKHYTLSFLDQSYPRIYMPVVLFFSANEHLHNTFKQLKYALSQTLTYYYPLAGRIDESRLSIVCNDEGVDFFETQTHSSLSDVLADANEDVLCMFFPSHIMCMHKSLNNLLVVQVCRFSCGGIAIGVCMSHKFGDAFSVITFLNDWGKLVKNPGQALSPAPQLISASIFPPHDVIRLPEVDIDRSGTVRKRFVFNASKITDLKAKMLALGSYGPSGPTRVEVVISQLCKTAKRVEELKSDSNLISSYVIIQNVNLRKRIVPPLPENVIGNLVSFFPVLVTNDISYNLHKCLDDMRAGLTKLCDKYSSVTDPKTRTSLVLGTFKELQDTRSSQKSVTTYKCTSWCKLPIYEVDFGWGKPVWVGFGRVEDKNTIALTDAKADGIEAWVTLEEQVMEVFERDEELLSFASFVG